jgi:hypothetical protein
MSRASGPDRPRRGVRKSILWIGLAVALLHLVGFWAFSGFRPLPKRPHVPPPNFVMAEARGTDPVTGEKVIYREYTISTRLEEQAKKSKGAE